MVWFWGARANLILSFNIGKMSSQRGNKPLYKCWECRKQLTLAVINLSERDKCVNKAGLLVGEVHYGVIYWWVTILLQKHSFNNQIEVIMAGKVTHTILIGQCQCQEGRIFLVLTYKECINLYFCLGLWESPSKPSFQPVLLTWVFLCFIA